MGEAGASSLRSCLSLKVSCLLACEKPNETFNDDPSHNLFQRERIIKFSYNQELGRCSV
jgi:hypothetical protein